MKSYIPQYVQNVLDDWDGLAFHAYDCFEKSGRVVMALEEDENNPSQAKIIAVSYDYQQGKPDTTVAGLLVKYDPLYEILVQFVDLQGNIRTQRLRTAPDNRNPMGIYFFEMLRRIEEEPNSVDMATLPEWFIQAVEKLNQSR